MKALLEQSGGVIFVGCMAGLGIAVRLILLVYYGSLSKACKRIEKTKNKTIVCIRDDLKRYEQRNQYIKNTTLYTDCRLAERKVLGIRVGSLEHFWQQSFVLVPLAGVLSALAGVLAGGTEREILFTLFVSCGLTFGLLLADLALGGREKQKRIRLYIKDYIDNRWMCQMSENTAFEEQEDVISVKSGGKRNVKQTAVEKRKDRGKREKPTQRRIAAVKKKGKAQEEKRRLTEELLRERRLLEARSFAEQRRMEREAEVQLQTEQVQEEAAATATEVSYETLLSEVLADYLV
jgi:hypothetical protein